ncbi:MAG: translation initiation factor IF-2 [Candidatus Sulcia muelleri]|uniref:Translation initiation factor IF-2 n=1 Tax=Karelsulcia muelleri (strain GWSS) TaxID=444179 RepID=A8Z647_KARMG|nr:translation initiation factor IF-2 [Candidatus Karelsulcia muelleri GWSS]MBS0018914.1 translation initiation factor IF-2 [Candidatus Karelsulcia muelleri]MCJ7422487.1 translation initiation factor IF-2 [Candidatus Karelsulcia muelleri]MCJ7468655.1 translation initiation factor IF-2 [Candidatus Karelsulcia muelleri]
MNKKKKIIKVLECTEKSKDPEKDLKPRSPVVTIMGHVDHGKTSLLDYIRKTNIIAGECGGITQHVGAYNVKFKKGNSITFLDTPGHEAFTSMRARGTKITDIVVIVIATDDDVMPQTKEAISHAQLAGVPIIFALNKIDKINSNPDKIRRQLSDMNFLLEEWGGKYQSQEISAKLGKGIDKLLEKILLEAEILNLKANPNKPAVGTVIDSFLDKGRGYCTTILIQEGTLKLGDYVVAGTFHGKVKVILDEIGNNLKKVLPSKPVKILGLNGPPPSGERFQVFKNEKEAKQLASIRSKLKKEHNIRKTITLEEIGRRIAIEDFKELKLIIKGDMDGSVEAITDSLEKLSTDSRIINIIYKNIGFITESDVLLAKASNAIIVGFNVKCTLKAKIIANKNNLEIRLYNIIYDIINDFKKALYGMNEKKVTVIGNAEIINFFKRKQIGTIAGCLIINGKIIRNSKIRLIRDGVVIYTGELISLKRFQNDVKEVNKGYECGIIIKDYNDFQIGDIIECYI